MTAFVTAWRNIYHVTCQGNGNTGGDVPTDPNTYVKGEIVTVQENSRALTKNTTQSWVEKEIKKERTNDAYKKRSISGWILWQSTNCT